MVAAEEGPKKDTEKFEFVVRVLKIYLVYKE